MIERLVSASVRHRRATLAIWGAFVLAAGLVAVRLKLDALPDLTNNQVQILTRAPGLTPEEVELRVTRPIEAALGGLPGLEHHRSLSRYGLSAVTAIFEDDVDPFRARQLVGERLQVLAGALPAGVDPPEMGPLTGGLGEVFHFTVSAERRPPSELLELVTLRIVPVLRSVPGIVEVNSWGGERRTFDVRADPVRLAARGLTLATLREALGQATGGVPGASVAVGEGQVLLRGAYRPTTPSALGAAIVTRTAGGEIVRVADVAEVREGALPRLGAATANGGGETVYVMAQMLIGANAREVTGQVRDKMKVVRELLPPDVRLELVYDRAGLVDGTLHTVGLNLLEGGLLVIAVLLLTLGSLRAGLLVALAIPLSMLGATAAMSLLGIPGNLLSLGALDFGLLVDGAVVFVEHVFQALRPRAAPADADLSWAERVRRASLPIAGPVFSSVLVILLVYVPVLSLTGADGKMFRPMALTVVFALFTALVLSLTFIPAAVAAALGPRHIPERPPWLVRATERVHQALLQRVAARPGLTALVAGALLAAALVLFLRAGTEFVPQLDEGDLVIQTTRRADISLEAAVAAATHMERVLRERFPEVTRVVSRVGSPAVATDIMGLEQADVFVGLRPKRDWRPGLTRDALIGQMERILAAQAPGSEPSFTQPIQMRFNELLGGSPSDVVVSVFGEDLGRLWQVATAVREAVAQEPGVEDARVLAPPSVSLVEVEPRPLDAAQLGFAVGDLLEAVRAVRLGVDVGVTYDGPVPIPLRLRLGAGRSLVDVERMVLPGPGGGLVPLGNVATIARRETPSLIQHDAGQRRLLVGFNVRGADLGTVVERAKQRVAARVQLPNGHHLTWGGQIETLAAANARLRLVIPAVLVLILLLLLWTFRDLRTALVILTHVPFACVGGIFALSARGMPASLSAAVGFIALSGVAVMNGVVLLARVREHERNGHPARAAALEAAHERARPVLMTALVAALGFVPMMLATGVGSEVQRPLATVVCGGLVTSTLLTLLILPTLYPYLAARRV